MPPSRPPDSRWAPLPGVANAQEGTGSAGLGLNLGAALGSADLALDVGLALGSDADDLPDLEDLPSGSSELDSDSLGDVTGSLTEGSTDEGGDLDLGSLTEGSTDEGGDLDLDP